MDQLPAPLRNAIEDGNAVLMLGAGASVAAKDTHGNSPPLGGQLATLLAKKFLTADHENLPLTQVADYAVSEGGFYECQDYVASLFKPFAPSVAHKTIPTFRWRAIVTTNYDCLIEDAYRSASNPAQEIAPILRNTDSFDRVMQDGSKVPLLKLHGCMTNTHEKDCPLILSTDTYVNYTIGRDRLFRLFMQLAAERPFLFIGYALQDQNIRFLLDTVTKEQKARPQSFLITRSVDDIAKRFWSQKQVTALAGTFEEAMADLDGSIGATFRGIRKTTPAGGLAIASKIVVAGAIFSENTEKALTFDLDYVQPEKPYEACDPVRFYSGASHTWSPIAQNLDVRRRLHDTVLLDYFFDDPSERQFIVIRSHAGSGKSVFLRRLAWEASRDCNKLCLYAQPEAILSSTVFAEIINLCKERVYLFVDDVLLQRTEIEQLLSNLGSLAENLTIIGGARTNEWNTAPTSYSALCTREYQLPYLTDAELDTLIELLEKHKALKALEKLSPTERREKLKERVGRQLLVALHEATSGKAFTDILHDEFHRLPSSMAKSLYLAICMLNQFDVPVRAGLIARRFGITFEDFNQRFFKPLEDVVITRDRKGVDDYCYTARHPHVAEIVVRNELRSVSDLYNEYVACLLELNLGYSSDKRAFQKMTQARLISLLFDQPDLVHSIYAKAQELVGDEDPFLLQQMAVYEMNRDNGNLTKATTYIERALELRYSSRLLKHTLAELYIKKADVAKTELEQRHFWSLAERVCRDMKRDATDSYPYCTLVKTGIRRLKALEGSSDAAANEDVESMISTIEQELKEGLLRFPTDSYLLVQEAGLAKWLRQWDRAFIALQKSFQKNHRNSNVALQLAASYKANGEIDKAQGVLKDAIAAHKTNTKLHLNYGKLLMDENLGTNEDMLYHFKHSYLPGDYNHDAQLLHGRLLFVTGDFEQSRQVFRALSKAKVSPDVKKRHCYPLPTEFEGTVIRQEAWYCQLKRDGDGAEVQLDLQDSDPETWKHLSTNTKVKFKIAFTMYGPEAFSVTLIGKNAPKASA
jgi:hypothetical protein